MELDDAHGRRHTTAVTLSSEKSPSFPPLSIESRPPAWTGQDALFELGHVPRVTRTWHALLGNCSVTVETTTSPASLFSAGSTVQLRGIGGLVSFVVSMPEEMTWRQPACPRGSRGRSIGRRCSARAIP